MESLAFVAGLLNIYLATKLSLWNWFFGIISVTLSRIIFFNAKLYADMGLQSIFLVFQFYVIYQWMRGGKLGKPLAIQLADKNIYYMSLVIAAILFTTISFILS